MSKPSGLSYGALNGQQRPESGMKLFLHSTRHCFAQMKQKLSKVTADLRVQRSSPRVGLPYHSPPAEVEYRNWGSNVSCGSSVSPYQSAPMSPVPRVAVSNASLRSPENLAAVERLSPGHREIESAAMQPELPDNMYAAVFLAQS